MSDQPVAITIYHNPACGTSRNALARLRNAGIEPTVIEYLKTPPDRATLKDLSKRMGMRPRQLLREKGTPYAELDLGADRWTDEQLIDQMLAHPILINRPIVVTPWGVRPMPPRRNAPGPLASPAKREPEARYGSGDISLTRAGGSRHRPCAARPAQPRTPRAPRRGSTRRSPDPRQDRARPRAKAG